jgi:hypothetical protein
MNTNKKLIKKTQELIIETRKLVNTLRKQRGLKVSPKKSIPVSYLTPLSRTRRSTKYGK